MTSQPGLQTIALHILPNISQSNGNQTMKLGQLREYIKKKPHQLPNDFQLLGPWEHRKYHKNLKIG